MKKHNKPVKYPGLFQYVPKIDVGVQKVWVKRHGLLKVVDSEPDLALGIEDAAKVRPGYCKVWSGLNCFQITGLEGEEAGG